MSQNSHGIPGQISQPVFGRLMHGYPMGYPRCYCRISHTIVSDIPWNINRDIILHATVSLSRFIAPLHLLSLLGAASPSLLLVFWTPQASLFSYLPPPRLYISLEGIDHTSTAIGSPQTACFPSRCQAWNLLLPHPSFFPSCKMEWWDVCCPPCSCLSDCSYSIGTSFSPCIT